MVRKARHAFAAAGPRVRPPVTLLAPSLQETGFRKMTRMCCRALRADVYPIENEGNPN